MAEDGWKEEGPATAFIRVEDLAGRREVLAGGELVREEEEEDPEMTRDPAVAERDWGGRSRVEVEGKG